METSKITDFAPLFQSSMTSNASLHPVIHINPFNGREILFLSDPNNTFTPHSTTISLSGLIDKIVTFGKTYREILYSHKWDEGDLLIWDNV